MDIAAAMQERIKGMFADVLGIRFVEASPDGITAELFVRDNLCTIPGLLHGGAIMAFADTLGAMGTVLNLPPGAGTTTIESKTNFMAGCRAGTTITGVTTPLHKGKRTLVWQTRVTNAEGKLAAVVTQTQMVLDPK